MSSESDIAVRVRGLSKSYTIAHQAERHVTLAESLLARARRPFARTPTETFWALKDVEIDINKGDVVGIIGRNGAGKSTLLKVLSRITEPTAGQIDLYGRVGSLLEVGTGFHPELTGRENVFLNGAILGMTKAEIRRQFEAIVDFAEVEKFLDTPIKRYSSGMYVRLAFAVAAHLDSEILIMDEVLAVGDAEFQKRCLGKIRDVASSGRTVLFVSHNREAITNFCTSAILLRAGKVLTHGDVQRVLQTYGTSDDASGDGASVELPPHRSAFVVKGVEVVGDDIHVSMAINLNAPIHCLGVGIYLSTATGQKLTSLKADYTTATVGPSEGRLDVSIIIPNICGFLTSGYYILGFSLHEYRHFTICIDEHAAEFFIPQKSDNVDRPVFPTQSANGPVKVELNVSRKPVDYARSIF